MLVGVVAEQSFQKAQQVMAQYQDKVDVFELRLDVMFASTSCSLENFISQIKSLLDYIKRPVIFTYRDELADKLSTCHLGQAQRAQNRDLEKVLSGKLNILYGLCRLNPDYIDLEDYVPDEFVYKIKQDFPSIKIIRSYHNYKNWDYTKAEQVLAKMQQIPADVYKIIGTASSSLDSLSVVDFIYKQKRNNLDINITAHCMGEKGKSSRLLGSVAGNYFTYVSLSVAKNHLISHGHCETRSDEAISNDTKLAPGIINIDELLNIYNHKKINSGTKIYALIGSPVEQSIGHVYHNKKFKDNNIDAVYVKFDVSKHELADFWGMIKTSELDFRGFSVTMPLKNSIAGLLGEYKAKRPYNTIKPDNNKVFLTNTDGEAVLDILADCKSDNITNKRLCNT